MTTTYPAQTSVRPLTTVVFTLVVIGLVFIYSSSSVFALERHGSAHYFFMRQLIGACIGLVGFVICAQLRVATIRRYAPLVFLASSVLTVATLIPGLGVSINGSRRWLSLHLLTIQPSELMKYAAVLYYALLLERKQFMLSSWWRGAAPYLFVVLIPVVILLMQPDFGQAVILVATAGFLWFVMHPPSRLFFMACGVGLCTALLLIIKAPYRLRRLLIFLNPWDDPHGAGFQIIQSLVAIGSGRLTGLGIAHSKQKFFYLPMQHTDFIGSIIAEETGFVGMSLMVLLYSAFGYYGFRAAFRATHTAPFLMIIALTTVISLQAAFNLSVICGMLPTKGIGLPFVSYGNSSLIAALWAVGILIACTREHTSATP